jgi:hypothetical protein
MAIVTKRKVSKEYATKLWEELQSAARIARRIGYTYTGTRRMLVRFGICQK